jgi:hypothetical protein
VSRHGKTRRLDRRAPAAEDVLSGAATPSIEQLLRLIHTVNPTGAGVPPAEASRRYALKTRLQSLLVRRFPDQIEVVPEASQPGLVSLQHRSGTRDACHAIVSELDLDARSWVQRRLDEGDAEIHEPQDDANLRGPGASDRGGARGPATEPAPGAHGDGAASDLVARARAAVADYDYEAALDDLQRALDLPGGARLAAHPLLELLVDNLGLDADALALAPRIGAEAADPTLRALLGLAAARLGRREEALRLAKGLAGSAAGRIHLTLARLALSAGDDETAERDLEGARRAAPANAEVEAVSAERRALRAAQRRPAEETLLAAQAAAEAPERLTESAAGILERWPESEVARRVLRALEAQSARTRREALFDRAEAALGAGDLSEARRLLREGQALGGDRTALRQGIETAEAEARERAEAEAVVAVAAALEAPASEPRRAALQMYLTLSPPLRARVRERVALPCLGWLEEAVHAGPQQALVEAILALERAQAAFAQDAPETARALLAEHAKALRGVRANTELHEQVQVALERREASRSVAVLAEAEAAMVAGNLEQARQHLATCLRRHLSDEARGRLRAVEERIGETIALRDLESRYAAALAAGDLFAARDEASRLATGAREGEREGWAATAGALRAKIRQAWRVWSMEGEPSIGLNGFAVDASLETNQWLSEDGRTLVLASVSGPWVFVREWDVPGCRVRRATALRAPEPLEALLTARLAGDQLWLCAESGALLVLGLAAGDVREFWNLGALLPEEPQELASVVLVPATRSAWVAARTEDAFDRLFVIDLERRRVSRELPRPGFVYPVMGEQETRVMVEKPAGTSVTVYHPRGTAAVHLTLPAAAAGVAVAPLGGLLALVGNPIPAGDSAEPFMMVLLDELGRQKASAPIARSDSALIHGMAPALACGHAFIAFGDDKDHRVLAAFSLAGPELRHTYRVGVPWATVLAGDDAGQRAVAVLDDGSEIRVVPLGETWPLPDRRHVLADEIPATTLPFFCDDVSSSLRAQALALWGSIGAPPMEALRRAIPAERERRAGDPTGLAALCVMIEREGGLVEEAGALARWALERHPDDPMLGYLAGRDAVRCRDWSAAACFLAARSSPVPKDIARHRAHLLVLASLGTGTLAGARAIIEAAERFRGLCRLKSLLPLTLPPEAFSDRRRWGAGRPRAWQVVGAVRAADAALARGDLSKALAALDRPAVWNSNDVQSLARLADVCLCSLEPSPAARFRRLEACARYRAARSSDRPSNLLLPGATWSPEKLDELAERCHASLEAAADETQSPEAL